MSLQKDAKQTEEKENTIIRLLKQFSNLVNLIFPSVELKNRSNSGGSDINSFWKSVSEQYRECMQIIQNTCTKLTEYFISSVKHQEINRTISDKTDIGLYNGKFLQNEFSFSNNGILEKNLSLRNTIQTDSNVFSISDVQKQNISILSDEIQKEQKLLNMSSYQISDHQTAENTSANIFPEPSSLFNQAMKYSGFSTPYQIPWAIMQTTASQLSVEQNSKAAENQLNTELVEHLENAVKNTESIKESCSQLRTVIEKGLTT